MPEGPSVGLGFFGGGAASPLSTMQLGGLGSINVASVVPTAEGFFLHYVPPDCLSPCVD